MDAIPFSCLPNKPHLFSLTKHKFIVIKLPSRKYYMFRPVPRPSSGISIQEHIQKGTI